MEREIVWRSLIRSQLDEIFVYLVEKYGSLEALRFLNELEDLVETLAKSPQIGINTEADRYSFPIRMYRLHYRFDEETIEIAYLQDMRSIKEIK